MQTTLNNVISRIIDYRGKTPLKLGYNWVNNGKYIALSAKNVKTGKLVNLESAYHGDEKLYKLWMKEEINRGDILLTSEAPFGQVYFWDSDEKIILSQRLFCLTPTNIVPQYLNYYMCSDSFQNELLSRSTGSTVTGLRQPALLACSINVPNTIVQQHIVGAIGSVDDLIEKESLLLRSLDSFGNKIYETSFSSKNETHYRLSDLCTFVPGYSYSGNELAESSTGMVSIKSVERNGGFKSDGIKALCPLKQIPSLKMCTTGDVLVAHTDLTKNQDIIGSPIIITTKSNFKQLTYSMDLVKVVSNTTSVGNALLFRILDSPKFKDHALGFCSGTTVVHLSRRALETFEFDGPQKGVKELSDRLDAIERQKAETTRKIEVLKSLKTVLLSKYFN